LLSVFG
jgi:hypothetical protein